MNFVDIENTVQGADRKEMEALFAPFILREINGPDATWDKAVEKRWRRTNWLYFKRRLLGWLPRYQRTDVTIKEEYSEAWDRTDYRSFAVDPTIKPVVPWVWGERRMFASTRGIVRLRQYLLVKLVEELRPRRILEVGCGNGINLLLLAGGFPDVEMAGLELTKEGYNSAFGFQAVERLYDNLLTFVPAPIVDDTAFRGVKFHHGSAAAMPFEDNAFDLIYTVLSVEQMEAIRHQALGEIARVCGSHAFFFEPFLDVNEKNLAYRYAYGKDYFMGRIDEMPRYGFEPIWATMDFPQKYANKAAAVLCRKTAASGGVSRCDVN